MSSTSPGWKDYHVETWQSHVLTENESIVILMINFLQVSPHRLSEAMGQQVGDNMRLH